MYKLGYERYPRMRKIPTKLTDYDKIEIVTKYQTGQYNCQNLADEFDVTRNHIKKILNRRGITKLHHRQYTLNEHYFDEINTEDKAYFLGLLFADGYNYEKKNNIHLSLQERDRHILEIFKEKLQTNRPISISILEQHGWANSCRLSITNKNISNQLRRYGCTQKKSLTLTFPSTKLIPKYLLHHFVRGYFDGDGSISFYKDKNEYTRYNFDITSTEKFCNSLSTVFRVYTKTKINCFRANAGKENLITSRIATTGKTKIVSILDWLYKDATIYLNRKYEIYLQIKNCKTT